MTIERERLARYQADLLDLLYGAKSVDDAKDSLLAIAESAKLRDRIGDVDPRMLDVAIKLTKKWGVHSSESG